MLGLVSLNLKPHDLNRFDRVGKWGGRRKAAGTNIKIIYTYKHQNAAAGCRAKLEDPRPVPVRPCREEDRKVELGRSAVAVLLHIQSEGAVWILRSASPAAAVDVELRACLVYIFTRPSGTRR